MAQKAPRAHIAHMNSLPKANVRRGWMNLFFAIRSGLPRSTHVGKRRKLSLSPSRGMLETGS